MCGPDLCSNSPQVGAHFMKFRLVWMGPEDDPDASPAARKPISQASSSRPSFQQRGTEMVRHEKLADGHVKVTALANFTARVVRDFLLDDDAGGRRDFELEAELDGRRIRFVLPAAEFGRMAWVLPRLGPRAIIYPGKQQHAREAIQSLSGLVPQEHIFTHLGWTKDASDWLYLHAGGAIGREGSRSEVQVRLPAAKFSGRVSISTVSANVIIVEAACDSSFGSDAAFGVVRSRARRGSGPAEGSVGEAASGGTSHAGLSRRFRGAHIAGTEP